MKITNIPSSLHDEEYATSRKIYVIKLSPHCGQDPLSWAILYSANGLLPVRRQAITWAKADLMTTEPLRTNFN